jgi:hypothetical protein
MGVVAKRIRVFSPHPSAANSPDATRHGPPAKRFAPDEAPDSLASAVPQLARIDDARRTVANPGEPNCEVERDAPVAPSTLRQLHKVVIVAALGVRYVVVMGYPTSSIIETPQMDLDLRASAVTRSNISIAEIGAWTS